MHCPGWCCVRERPYGIGNPAPGHRAVVIAVGRKLVDTRGALLKRLLAIAFEHQVGGSPNIDLRYHATKGARLRSKPFNFVLHASTYQSALLSSPQYPIVFFHEARNMASMQRVTNAEHAI